MHPLCGKGGAVKYRYSGVLANCIQILLICQERTIIRIQKYLDDSSFLRYRRHFCPIFPLYTTKTPSARLSNPVDGVFLFCYAGIPFLLSWHLWVIVALPAGSLPGREGSIWMRKCDIMEKTGALGRTTPVTSRMLRRIYRLNRYNRRKETKRWHIMLWRTSMARESAFMGC